MTVASFACGFDFDADVFEVTKITDPTLRWHGTKVVIDEETEEEIEVTQDWDEGPTSVSSIAEANNDGHVGVVFAGTDDVTYNKKLICIITLKVKADAPNGGTDIVFFEDSDGADGFNSVAAGANLSATLTIGSTEPAPPECEHTETKLVPNGDGTHNVVCTNETCNGYVVKTENCSGTDDGDHTTAVTCACGYTVTAGTAHKDENPKDHKCDYGCGTDMGEHKSNADYPCMAGTCEYCGKTVPAATTHKDESPKDHKCDYGCGTDMGEHKSNAAYPCMAGTCDYCGEPIRATADHSYTPGTPVWSDNNTKCTVTGTCACGATTTAVTTNIKTQVTEANCQTPEGTTHTATFTEPWVGNMTTGSTGNTNPDKHPEEFIDTKTETVTEADCENAATFRDIEYCTKCGKTISTGEPYSSGDPLYHNWNTPTYSWSADGKTCTATRICKNNEGHKEEETVTGTPSVTTVGTCQIEEVVTYTANFDAEWAQDGQTNEVTGEKNPDNHDKTVHEYTYTDNRNGTHTVQCACGEILKTTEPHDYTTGTSAHTCACEAVEKFTVTWTVNGEKYDETTFEYGAAVEAPVYVVSEGYTFYGWDVPATMPAENLTINATLTANEYTLTVNVRATGKLVDLTVPYGANLLEVLSQAVTDDKIPALGEPIEVNIEDSRIGEETPFGYSYLVSDELGYAPIDETFTMPAGDLQIDQDCIFTGWDIYDGNYAYMYDRAYLETGWHYIEEDFDGVDGGAWYYFYEGTGDWEGYFRAEGLTRAPYPSKEIKGITYAPDADAVASDPNFIDATEAWFMFGDDGKFQYDAKGIVDNSKLVNGMLAWHPGLVKIPGSPFYHYFLGNEEIGGNIGADGDVWVTRIAEGLDRQFVLGGIYTFEDSKLCEYTGITEVGGKLRFYGSEGADENRLMAGNGLTKVGENFIYVRSNGELVVNADYYVPTNDKGIVPGTYHFDENGFLVNPELTTKNGIVAENGGLFFYENGKIAYNKGLIQYNGGIIYVRSNGQLAVGEYYVTNLANFNGNDVKYGDKVTFGDDGYMVAAKNGIVDGMYYIDNQIAYNAGVVQLENGKYIYVKSNGTVVMNTNYWITNVGDTGVVAKLYSFDANGYFTPEFTADQKDGIVDGYYYVDGKIAYGAGLIYLEDEDCYIYVRSNGKLATGIYWPTTTNGHDFSGRYDFGNDGKLYI